jgi:hypothetical protein
VSLVKSSSASAPAWYCPGPRRADRPSDTMKRLSLPPTETTAPVWLA